jgi:coenzyme Q-binding protein COQ10
MSHAASKEIVIDVPRERFFDVLLDYERYPEFVPKLKACRVLKVEARHRDVEYELDLGVLGMGRRIRYVLRHVEERPRRLSWSLVRGDMMKVSNGSWELSDEGGKTRARYSVEVQIQKPPLVPQSVVDAISDQMTRSSLPGNLEAFKARAEGGR